MCVREQPQTAALKKCALEFVSVYTSSYSLDLLEFRGLLVVRDALGNLGLTAPLELAIRQKSTLLRHRVPEV